MATDDHRALTELDGCRAGPRAVRAGEADFALAEAQERYDGLYRQLRR